MAFSLFRKKRRRKGRVRVKGTPPRAAASKSAPGRKASPRRAPPAARPAPRRRNGKAKAAVGGVWTRRNLSGVAFRSAIALFMMGGLVLMYFAATLPDIRDLDKITKQQGITVETADGRIIATYGDVYGTYIPYERFPRALIEAVIATEDRRFFQHHGVDFLGILRAMVANVAAGRAVQGGSTITQQVAKNVFLNPDRTLSRKLREALLAFWLEGRYSKEEIMAIYLNRVYLGSGTFGADAAARRYFNKPGTDLNLVESAMIAGLLKAPSRYAPTASSERAIARARQVLLNMADHGSLKKSQIEPALAAFAKEPKHTVEGGDVRYYADWIVDAVPDYVGNIEDDIIVITSFDPKVQTAAADALENTLAMEGEGKKVSQGAVVVMAPDGAVKAMVGGKSYSESQYNRAAQAKRQPGSSFKLFVYLAALEAGYQPMAQVEDAPVSMMVGNKVWSPDNYTGDYKGLVTMTQGFKDSLNTVAVRLSQYAGIPRVAQMAERLGLSRVPNAPSIALGSVEATLLEMTGAYAHLANNGNKVTPHGISEIRTSKGEVLYKREQDEANPVLATGTVQMMNHMMKAVTSYGTGTRAALPGRETAGKTGTSQDYKDAWFIGFTPQLVAGVWVGNDNNRPMVKVTGGNLPAMIWHDTMIKALEGMPAKPIPSASSSGEGLLPWLFGGSSGTTETPSTESAVPDSSPFGYMNDGNEPARAIGAPLPPGSQPIPVQGGSPSGVPVTPPAPVEEKPAISGDGGVLDKKFWNTLMDGVPSKGEMEYSYPGQ